MKVFKFGVEICDRKYKKYGGHWRLLADLLHIDYLVISFCPILYRKFDILYYDGYHAAITFLFFNVAWGPWTVSNKYKL